MLDELKIDEALKGLRDEMNQLRDHHIADGMASRIGALEKHFADMQAAKAPKADEEPPIDKERIKAAALRAAGVTF